MLSNEISADEILDHLFYFQPKFSDILFSIVSFGYIVTKISANFFKADFLVTDKVYNEKVFKSFRPPFF